MTLDFDLTLKAASFFISIAAMVFAVIRTRRTAVDDRFKIGSDRMDRHENRIARLEQTVDSLPGREELHKVQLGLTEVKGQLSSIERAMSANRDSMNALSETSRRIEDYLLNKKA
ncbi:DUF2730 family protein [Citreimonas salinaria]|uniref:DUF2730 family protein n=1 Tax=Citreimonas salinaria TaxID=321339 RepID=A0A1H3KSF7_9RHOB|nr:DUF2730 family protein [Citreimonas salinaria]SDY55103.1 Protein of unknown function [Citreimonas salinaria]